MTRPHTNQLEKGGLHRLGEPYYSARQCTLKALMWTNPRHHLPPSNLSLVMFPLTMPYMTIAISAWPSGLPSFG